MGKKKAKRASGKKKSRRGSKARDNEKLPKDAVTLAVILRPREGQEFLLEAELRALLAPTRKEDGCLRYDLHRSAEGPPAYLLHEIWETREHHTAHTGSFSRGTAIRVAYNPARLILRLQVLELCLRLLVVGVELIYRELIEFDNDRSAIPQ